MVVSCLIPCRTHLIHCLKTEQWNFRATRYDRSTSSIFPRISSSTFLTTSGIPKQQSRVKSNLRKYRGRRGDSTDRRQTIQSARQVCQLFNQLASPLLCPILQVQLDQASLDLANDISRNPLIAAGVRGIQAVLDYRPEELATDLSRLKDQRKKDLSGL